MRVFFRWGSVAIHRDYRSNSNKSGCFRLSNEGKVIAWYAWEDDAMDAAIKLHGMP